MDYGIGIPSYIDAWREVRAAEEAGFTHAWFYDSQLIYSDVYATMALAAQNTSRIKLGTLVAIPSNRIAPVTASAIATINKLAPGRVILAMGTGYTGRNTMGLPQITINQLRDYTRQVRGLLRGEDVLFREGDLERWVRLIHADLEGFINIKDPIPVYIAANGPRGQQVTGELADGWVTTLRVRRSLEPEIARICDAARQSGRSTEKPYTVALEFGCVLREGESLNSDRVMARVGPSIMPGLHAQWEAAFGLGANLGMRPDPEMTDAFNTYIQEYAESTGTASDRLYLDAHRGHMVFLKPDEAQFVTQEAIGRTLTGTGPEIIDKLESMEANGVDSVAISVTDLQGARDLIEDFGREVIAKRG